MKHPLWITLIVLFCAINGALIWFLAIQKKSKTITPLSSRYISVPNCLDIEKEDAFFPIRPDKIPSGLKTIKITRLLPQDPSSKHQDIFHYDENGHLVERGFYISEGNLKTRWLFEYDNRGNRISDKSNSHLDTVYNYDEKGSRIVWKNYDLEGKETSWAILKYDDNQRLIEETRYNTAGYREIYIYNYDRKGSILQRLYYEPSLTKRDIFVYNDNGKRIEWMEWYETSGCGKRESYLYDEAGRLVEIKYYSGGNVQERRTYQYEEKGNLTEEQRLGPRPDCAVYKINYHYNEKGLPVEKSSCIILKEPQTGKEQISNNTQNTFEYEFYPE